MHDEGNLDEMSDKCFKKYLKVIHEVTGITINDGRKSMVQGRVRKRIRSLGLTSYEAYLTKVTSDDKERLIFIDLVTTNETYFFRTPRIWSYLELEFLPTWFARNPKRVFSAWSAAASSGEEAHSMGIVCQDFRSKNPSFHYSVLGTDISQEMVALCQKGIYSHRSIEAFRSSRAAYFHRFMRGIDAEQFQAIQDVRSRVRFQRHNLFDLLPGTDHFSVVLLRNVLIYFTQPDQQRVLDNIYSRLADDGVLIIGESESLSHIQVDFKMVSPLVYVKTPRRATQPKAG